MQKFKTKLKLFIAVNRDEIIGAIGILVFLNMLFLGIIYIRQTKGLDNQKIMLGNDEITIRQNKSIIDSIDIKWRNSYNNFKNNGREKTRPN